MIKSTTVPMLVTFDGEARTGKGTIVQATKDYLRDTSGYKVMLIDRGQTFRVLVVATARAGVDPDDVKAVDAFLENDNNVAACVQFVKDVYHMAKDERDALLYTNEVGENSAKIGARPASQTFVKMLTKKWLHDAGQEDYDVVLVDGRALESIAREMDQEGLCDYRLGLYFTCDAVVGARRTLGYAAYAYDALTPEQRAEVDTLVVQIRERDRRDRERAVEPMLRPTNVPRITLPDLDEHISGEMLLVDTSAEMTKEAMSVPIAQLVERALRLQQNTEKVA